MNIFQFFFLTFLVNSIESIGTHVFYSINHSLPLQSSVNPSYAKYPDFFGRPRETFLELDSIPLLHLEHNGMNLVEYSYADLNLKDPLVIKSPKALSMPVARDMLFSEDGKYVPFDIDHRNIYKNYLRSDLFLLDCQNYINEPHSPNILFEDLQEAFRYAESAVRWYEKTILADARISNRMMTPFIPPGVLPAKFLEYTSQYLLNSKCISKYDASALLPKIDVQKFLVQKYMNNDCSSAVTMHCDPNSPYRTIDASCNNLRNPSWGKSFTCHRRLLPPDYADGIEVPRVAHDGSDLPNTRILSSQLLPDIPIADNKLTSMTMAFGQFVVHDIAKTVFFGSDIKCCPSSEAKHPECLPIEPLLPNDFLYQAYNQTCLNFVRTIVCNPCSLGPREQLNQATQVFDMSQLYGLRLNETLPLRSFEGGKLRSGYDAKNEEMLPPSMTTVDRMCNIRPKPPRFRCFESGDGIRASQHPALQALHATFHRRHNQHTDALALVNPHWDDERLFQEARRILIAEETKIIYGEYLPAIMGKTLTKHFGLDLTHSGYSTYDPTTNPSTIQEYIVAAGRFGHSQINDLFRVLLRDKSSYSYLLRDNFFEPTAVSLGHSGGILRGLITDLTASSDPFFTDDVKNYLYKLRTENFGRDLPAFNIMRGREHGVPAYVYYLDYCFGHWKDIDLFVGGVSERRISDAAFGPTFACMNGIQFYHFKFGDRFYFEHGHQSGSFSLAQLDNIRRVTSLGNLLCKTQIDFGAAQPNVFFQASQHNPLMPCHMYPEIDYSLWAETYYDHSSFSI